MILARRRSSLKLNPELLSNNTHGPTFILQVRFPFQTPQLLTLTTQGSLTCYCKGIYSNNYDFLISNQPLSNMKTYIYIL